MIPYTYVLFHEKTGFKYYGCQYGKNCHPSNLWLKYFTSSKKVKQLLEEYGADSFSYQIRKTFKTPIDCRVWEIKVIRRMNLVRRKDFLNQRNPGGLEDFIRKNYKPWNYGLKGKNDPRCENKMKGKTGRYSEEHRKNLSYKSSKSYKNIEVREKHSEKVRGSGNPCFGKIWVNNGVIEKRIFAYLILDFAKEGFVKGKLKRIYVNNGVIEKSILPNDLNYWISLGYKKGQFLRNRDKISGKFINNEDI